MKLLIYGLNYTPELIGVGRFTGEMGSWFARRGHEVRVVTAPPYYPAWRVARGYSALWWRREELAGVRVYRCPLWVPPSRPGAARVLHLLSFAFTSAPVALALGLFWRPDVVLAVAPTLATAPAARLAAGLAGALSWLHMQDFEVEAAFDLGLLATARGWHRRLALAAERVVLKSFARVSTISHRMEKRLRVKGVADERIVSFPNWVDTAEIHPLEGPNPYRDELALSPDSVVALYAGNFGEKQGVETLLDVARRLRDGDAMERRIVIVLCGDGAARHDIHRLAERLENVRVLPLQPKERFNQLLNLADIHLLPQRVGAADLVMPSKLGGMLASGRPVIAAAAAGTQVADEVVGRGIVVPPEDAAAMAAAVSRLARDPVERARLGAAARAYAVEAWDRERILLRFESQLEALRR